MKKHSVFVQLKGLVCYKLFYNVRDKCVYCFFNLLFMVVTLLFLFVDLMTTSTTVQYHLIVSTRVINTL